MMIDVAVPEGWCGRCRRELTVEEQRMVVGTTVVDDGEILVSVTMCRSCLSELVPEMLAYSETRGGGVTEYRRVSKLAETRDAVEELKLRLTEVQAEREALQEKTDQAEKVVNRWRETYNRRTSELDRLDRKISEINSALDILAPEVDEYGIERKFRERTTA